MEAKRKRQTLGFFGDFVVCSINRDFLVSLTLFEHLTILRMLSFGYAIAKLCKVVQWGLPKGNFIHFASECWKDLLRTSLLTSCCHWLYSQDKWQFTTPFEIPFGPEPSMDIPPPSLAQKFLVIPTFASKNVGWFYLPWGRSIFPCLSETWVMGQNRGSKSQVYWAARHGLNSRFVLRSWLWCPFVVLTGGGEVHTSSSLFLLH